MPKILIFLCALIVFCVPVKAEDTSKVGTVISVSDSKDSENLEQIVKLEIDEQGKKTSLFINNNVPNFLAYQIKATPGKKYLINFDSSTNDIYIADYYREPTIIFLIILLGSLIIAIGGIQGIKALASLLLTGFSIVFFLIPAIKNGYNPVWVTILIAFFSTTVTMIFVAGFSKKALAATLGTTGGVAIAGILAATVVKLAPLSGMASEEAHILVANQTNFDLDFQGILAAGIIISSLGASMDVAISLASAAQEIYEANCLQTKRELFSHAMTVGKDIMATMANTLILAYAGASIPLFLLLLQETGLRLLNMEIIATEIASASIGSIGLLLAIPLTAAISALLLKMGK